MVNYLWYSYPIINLPKDNPVLNEEQEVFLPVKGFENLYQISNLGRVTNSRKILKTYQINNGYECLKLVKDGVRYSYLLHRLVAEHFIPNQFNKPEVNHIDGNKSNNKVSNLEWNTVSENRLHALKTGLKVYNEPSKGIKIGKGSKYFNVTWDKARNKWVGSVRHESKTHFQKRFESEEDAARHVNWIIDTLGLTDRPKNIVL